MTLIIEEHVFIRCDKLQFFFFFPSFCVRSLDSAKPCSHWFIVVLWSVITALKLAKEKGVSQLWIETDCTPVMDCILNKRVQKGVPFAPLVESILELMTNFDGSSLPLLS